MDEVTEQKRTIPVYDEVDVVVCGGGVAGVAAAVCAARCGAKVILLERCGYLGGLATGGLVITVPPLDNGINSEVRLRLEEARTYQECANLGDDPAVDGLIAVDPEILKFELLTLLLDSGAKLLLHTSVVGSLDDDGRVTGVIVENKAGRSAIRAAARDRHDRRRRPRRRGRCGLRDRPAAPACDAHVDRGRHRCRARPGATRQLGQPARPRGASRGVRRARLRSGGAFQGMGPWCLCRRALLSGPDQPLVGQLVRRERHRPR